MRNERPFGARFFIRVIAYIDELGSEVPTHKKAPSTKAWGK